MRGSMTACTTPRKGGSCIAPAYRTGQGHRPACNPLAGRGGTADHVNNLRLSVYHSRAPWQQPQDDADP